MHFNLTQCS